MIAKVALISFTLGMLASLLIIRAEVWYLNRRKR